jgi:hypothetical protein
MVNENLCVVMSRRQHRGKMLFKREKERYDEFGKNQIKNVGEKKIHGIT